MPVSLLMIAIFGLALLLATWFAAEWASRRITARYAGRRRMWNGTERDDEPGAGQ